MIFLHGGNLLCWAMDMAQYLPFIGPPIVVAMAHLRRVIHGG